MKKKLKELGDNLLKLHQHLGTTSEQAVKLLEEIEEELEVLAIERETARRLRKADIIKTDFLAIASHELRTPLAIIKSEMENLGDGIYGKLSSKQTVVLQRLADTVDRLSALVFSLFDLSAIESGARKLQENKVRIEPLIRHIVELCSPLAKEKGISLRCRIPKKLPVLQLDVGGITQVISNLAENAIKFTPEGGEVTIAARTTDGEESNIASHVCVEVSDTGIGISEDELPKVFDRLYRGNNENASRKGAGLGLTISKKLVELHGGEIRVESAPNKGSTFSVFLPRARTARDESAAPVRRFGDVATELGYVSPEQIQECISLQNEATTNGQPHRFLGELMLEKGFLTKEQWLQVMKTCLDERKVVFSQTNDTPILGRIIS